MSKLWCKKHNHLKRSCPWCEIEGLEAEIEDLKGANAKVVALAGQATEKHLAEIERLRKGRQWISVKERLPEPYCTVFAYCQNSKARFIATHTGDGTWYGGAGKTQVTHWMPLPEPPAGMTEGEKPDAAL